MEPQKQPVTLSLCLSLCVSLSVSSSSSLFLSLPVSLSLCIEDLRALFRDSISAMYIVPIAIYVCMRMCVHLCACVHMCACVCRELASPEDFVAFKLDVDTPSVEVPIALQLRDEPDLAQVRTCVRACLLRRWLECACVRACLLRRCLECACVRCGPRALQLRDKSYLAQIHVRA